MNRIKSVYFEADEGRMVDIWFDREGTLTHETPSYQRKYDEAGKLALRLQASPEWELCDDLYFLATVFVRR